MILENRVLLGSPRQARRQVGAEGLRVALGCVFIAVASQKSSRDRRIQGRGGQRDQRSELIVAGLRTMPQDHVRQLVAHDRRALLRRRPSREDDVIRIVSRDPQA